MTDHLAERIEMLLTRLRTSYDGIGRSSGRPYIYFVYPPKEHRALLRLVEERLQSDAALCFHPVDLLRVTVAATEGQEERRCELLEDPRSPGAGGDMLRVWTRRLIKAATTALDELDAAFADPDAIGWAYQFYQEEAKAQVYLRLKGGKNVTTRDQIAAATQLFTEPYMVRWLLQNSLGRSYHEAYPDSALPATWEYYIRPDVLDAPATTSLDELTLLDPCMGSGHFLREAFDMFVAMYRERQPDLSAAEIADRVLAEHLHGIDLDPRAAQFAAFTLYARAWELARDERRAARQPVPGSYTPTAMSLATTPDRIVPGGLARHLQRHPEDRILEPFLDGVFAALEQADILGSLLRPREQLQAAIAVLREARQLGLGTHEEMDLQAAIEAVARLDPAHLEGMLLDRAAAGFAAEARGTDDVAAALFGRAGERGARLLQLLDRQYAVLVTNPPYMGSGNMDTTTLRYVERHYAPGKRDLYAAFILRNLELAHPQGRVAMVTQQSWMFLSSFAALRAVPGEDLAGVRARGGFTGMLRETCLESLAHLGPNAFEEISGEVVQSALFVAAVRRPGPAHTLTALRLVGLKSAGEKAAALQRSAEGRTQGLVAHTVQMDFLPIPDAPIVYWLRPQFFELMQMSERLRCRAVFVEPLTTGDNVRFLRQYWEHQDATMWKPLAKGGGYVKWYGLRSWSMRWDRQGAAIKAFPGSYIRNEEWMFDSGVTYSEAARGKLGARLLDQGEAFGKSGPGIIVGESDGYEFMSAMNARVSSYLIRVSARGLLVSLGAIGSLPRIRLIDHTLNMAKTARTCTSLKRWLAEHNAVERAFIPDLLLRSLRKGTAIAVSAIDTPDIEARLYPHHAA